MDKRYLFKVVMAVAVVFVVTVVTIVSMMIVKSNEMQGKLVFASTYDDGENVDKIVITTAEDVIELNQNDSFWTVKNKDGYFDAIVFEANDKMVDMICSAFDKAQENSDN